MTPPRPTDSGSSISPVDTNEQEATQAAVRRFLRETMATDPSDAEEIETHASALVLAGDHAFKMKRPVHYDYLDYSTLDARERYCRAEVEINRRTAPDLYRGCVPVTRTAAGDLVLNGDGEPVEWLVWMKRFDSDALLDRIAVTSGLEPALCRRVADTVFEFHRDAAVAADPAGADGIARVIDGDLAELHHFAPDVFRPADIDSLAEAWRAQLRKHRGLLDTRARDGFVRHCHGDLHLRNIVMLDGAPTLFDAIEFDPAFSHIDTLYDLAFLLMDLLHRDMRMPANRILNRYVGRSGDVGGLSLLPLFLSLRAAIRAHTTASAADHGHPEDPDRISEAQAYLALALAVLQPGDTRLIAIGGLSGSGKSTVAAALAPDLGGPLGALVLRSDLIRKRLRRKAPETRLEPDAYRETVSRRVFTELAEEAGVALDAGMTVIADCVFGSRADIDPVKIAAARRGHPLEGFWLDVPADILRERVAGRRDDASDAGVAVLERQLATIAAPAAWTQVDGRGSPEEVVERMRACLLGAGPAHTPY